MDKRVLIFSPYRRYQDGIECVVRDYFIENIKRIYEINIQKFSYIGESIDSGNRIGMGGEFLVIFDRKLCPREKRKKLSEQTETERIYFDGLGVILEMSKKICDDGKIPYLMYEGEIEKGEKNLLIGKLNKVKRGIEVRLEELEKENIDFLPTNRF